MSIAIFERRALIAAALAALLARPGAAQRVSGQATPSDLARAEALLRAGRVDAAETMFYRAVKRRPRDPATRLALGRYLASRGATRPGAVLIEEARFFGASATVAAIHLAPLYQRLWDFKALALLPAAPLTSGERARAEWLVKNVPAIAGGDSVTVAFAVADDSSQAVGMVALQIDGATVEATIDPAVGGISLDTSFARTASVKGFASSPAAIQAGTGATPAVALRATLGGFTFTNLAVSLEPMGAGRAARVGLDFLSRFAPTFDPHRGQLTLRRGGKVARSLPGERVPLLVDAAGSWVVWEGRPESLSAADVTRRLRGARWTLDAKRGEIVLHP